MSKEPKILITTLSDIWQYLNLCREQDAFFERELSNEHGFFAGKINQGLPVHEKNTSDYIAYCVNHFHSANKTDNPGSKNDQTPFNLSSE